MLPIVLYLGAIVSIVLSIFWKPRAGLYYLVPLLPLQTIRYKMLAYPLGNKLVFLVLGAVIVGLLRQGDTLLPGGLPLKRFLYIFALIHFVSLWWGSLNSGLPLPLSIADPRFENWVNYMIMPALYFITAAAFKDSRQIKLLVLLMCAGAFIADWSFFNTMRYRDLSSFSYGVRYAGVFGYAGENGLGAFEAQFSLFVLAVAAFEKQRLLKIALLLLVAANLYGLLFSFSRGAYISFVLGLIFLGVKKDRKLLIAVLVLAIGWQVIVPTAVTERILMTVDDSGELDHSAETRVSLWQDAAQLFLSSPLFGSGFDTYRYMHRVDIYSDTHNMYLKILVELGLVGLGLFLCLLFFLYRQGNALFRISHDPFLSSLGLGLAAMVGCVFIANLFGDRWTYLQVSGSLWVLLGCVVRGHMICAQEQAESMADEESIASEFDAEAFPVEA
jgi:putative inorganic carbon (hco3(-)) transporter